MRKLAGLDAIDEDVSVMAAQSEITMANPRSIAMALVAVVLISAAVYLLPYVPNWPYTGAGCLAIASVAAVVCWFVGPQISKTSSRMVQWALIAALFFSYMRLTTEDLPSIEFENAVVTSKYISDNHSYFSVNVRLQHGDKLSIEGISKNSWELINVGSQISKSCGQWDVTLVDQ